LQFRLGTHLVLLGWARGAVLGALGGWEASVAHTTALDEGDDRGVTLATV